MTQKDFLNEVIEAYLKARDVIYKPKKNSQILSRGTSHTISSITEDLFGCYCAEKVIDSNKIKIVIDPQISFKNTDLKNKSGKRPLLIRPDVAFVNKNNVATCFFDVKTDLGYKRNDLLNQARLRNDQMESIKNQPATYKDGKDKSPNDIKIGKKIVFNYIIISQGNINKDKIENVMNEIEKLDNIDIFLLSKGNHLNSYSDSFELKINKDFNRLDKVLSKYL